MILLYAAEEGMPLSQSQRLAMEVAGADTNFAIAIVRLGFDAGWISRVGSDPLGDRVLMAIADEGVDVSQVRRDPEKPTGIYFKYVDDENQARVMYYRRDSAASKLDRSDVCEEYFSAVRLLHLNGMTLALSDGCRRAVSHAVEFATARQAKVSLDLNLRLQLWDATTARGTILPLLRNVDVLLGTEEELSVLFELSHLADNLRAAQSHGPATVVAKLGPMGATALVDGLLTSHPGFVPPRIVDTVGAGDGFDAGFLACLLRGGDTAMALRQGNLIGATAVTVRGDSAGYPKLAEIDRLLNSWPERSADDAS